MKSICIALLLLVACAAPASAHDTDQFSVPVGQEMADLGPMISRQPG